MDDTEKSATLLLPRSFPPNSRCKTLLIERQKSLGSKELQVQIKLPQGANEDEWLAVKTNDFFNELNLLKGALQGLLACGTSRQGNCQRMWPSFRGLCESRSVRGTSRSLVARFLSRHCLITRLRVLSNGVLPQLGQRTRGHRTRQEAGRRREIDSKSCGSRGSRAVLFPGVRAVAA